MLNVKLEGVLGDPLFAKVLPWHDQLATSIGHVALRTYFALFVERKSISKLHVASVEITFGPQNYGQTPSTVRQWRQHDQKLPYFQL